MKAYLALAAVFLAAGCGNGSQSSSSNVSTGNTSASRPDPAQQAKDAAVAAAMATVPKYMRDPSSAEFDNVWGMAPGIACGTVNGKNAFGAMAGEQRFIFVMNEVTFENGSRKFAHQWNTLCVDKLLSSPPNGVMGRRWGSRPTADLKVYMPTTDEGLSLYVPKGTPAAFENIPVAEADYQYDHRRLYGADLYIDGEANRDAAHAALEKLYGTPLEADNAEHAYKWSWPDRHVTVSMRYEESHSRTTIAFDRGS